MRLETLLLVNPGIRFAAWRLPDGQATIDFLSIPERHRRTGLGTMVYQVWENTLPQGTRIELYAVDADASRFWRSLGFTGEDNGPMAKLAGERMRMAA